MTSTNKPRRDLHAEITNRLIAAIEQDPGKPQMPWRRNSAPLGIPENALSKNTYNGINIVNLMVAAECRGFTSPLWATYKQWAELGAQVRKGARSELIIFYKQFEVEPLPMTRMMTASVALPAHRTYSTSPKSKASPLPISLSCLDLSPGWKPLIDLSPPHVRASFTVVTAHIIVHPPIASRCRTRHLFTGTDTMTRDESYYGVLLHELHTLDVA